MGKYLIRKATENDIDSIVKIYNSNIKFLRKHLDVDSIDCEFINSEMKEMEIMGFFSCVIIKENTGEIIGVIDYKPDAIVYLSLIMIDFKLHGKGIGNKAYRIFENDMILSKKQSIRIDVVTDFESSVNMFWEKQRFIPQNEVQLEWGNNKINALVMLKFL